MENEPLVSVIIPCYNVSPYVEKAIRSILDQTYSNLEIFIIDDASTDDTLQKIQSFKDNRIIVKQYTTNTQKIGAVNDVLKEVKGDFIAFQDADDWSEPSRIEKQVNQFLKNKKLGICFTGYKYFGEKESVPGKVAITNDELRDEFLSFGNKKNKELEATVCGTMMISAAALQLTKGYHHYFKGRVGEDIHWVYRILKSYEGITVPEVLYHYRLRNGSFTWQQFEGGSAKFVYAWPLLKRIIYLDIHKSTDVLCAGNEPLLHQTELEACEEALINQVKFINDLKRQYEQSRSYRLGKLILYPFKIFRK